MNKKILIIILVSLISITLLSCSEDKKAKKSEIFKLDGEEVVLAKVNGSEITQFEVEQAIITALGEFGASRLDSKGRKKVLESLVASRAIAQTIEKELDPEDKALLIKKTEAYREQLLVKMYLARHATPTPVTQEMVKQYYEKHPDRFGGKTIRDYEMIASKTRLKGADRDKLIKALKNHEAQKDWRGWVENLKKRGHAIDYRKGRVTPKLLKPEMRGFLASLKKGQTSKLTFIKGMAYIARITSEKDLPPKPLGEVSKQIRKMLGPVQLKKAVKKASDEVLKDAKVEYMNK